MDEEQEKLFKEDFNLLLEAGFLAVKQLDEMSASRLFRAAQQISPHSTAPQIGVGYIALNKLEVKEAAAIFEKVVEQEPENYLAQVFLGISYMLLKHKRAKGERMVQEAMEKSEDPTVVHLAKLSLEWAEKDLKSGKTKLRYDDGSKELEQEAKEKEKSRQDVLEGKTKEASSSAEEGSNEATVPLP